MPPLKPTKLHELLADKTEWDNRTWFQARRYLIDNNNLDGIQRLVRLAGCEPQGDALHFKTDAVALLHELSPGALLRAWDRWRARR
jgi:hypothetical protein